MKINGSDIRLFNAKQMTVEFQPSSIKTNAEWSGSNLLPLEFETVKGFSLLKLKLYFKSKDRSTTIRNIAKLLSLIDGSVELEIDGYKGKYKGYISGDPNVESTKQIEKKYLLLTFNGYMFDDEITINVKGGTQTSFELTGARKSPCILEITASVSSSNFYIKGIGSNDIEIKTLKVNETLIIDGKTGLITTNGENAFETIDIWELPYIKKVNNVEITNTNVSMKIKYNPMWV